MDMQPGQPYEFVLAEVPAARLTTRAASCDASTRHRQPIRLSARWSIPALIHHPSVMSSSSRGQSASKRLLNELRSYETDPNDALLSLGPVDDDELMHWAAVMKGVPGTAYEGTRLLALRTHGYSATQLG